MAVHLTHATALRTRFERWTPVLIRPKRVYWNDTLDPVSPVIPEMLDWLYDEQHAGHFWVDAMPLYKPITLFAFIDKAEFYFEEGNTAFMFKMRWG